MGENLSIIRIGRSLDSIEAPPLLKPGKYAAQVIDVNVAKSAKGNDYYAIQFIVPPESYPADQEEELIDSYPDGITLTWNRYTVPRSERDGRAIYNMRRLYTYLGLDMSSDEINPDDWMGAECKLQTRLSKFDGEDRMEIQSLLPLDDDSGEDGGAEPAAEEVEEKPARRAPAKKPAPARRGR